jgi:hypothetical protein
MILLFEFRFGADFGPAPAKLLSQTDRSLSRRRHEAPAGAQEASFP